MGVTDQNTTQNMILEKTKNGGSITNSSLETKILHSRLKFFTREEIYPSISKSRLERGSGTILIRRRLKS